MTRPARSVRRFDPLRPLDMLTSLWSATAMVPVNSGAAAAYRALFVTMRRLVVGRRLTVRMDDGDLTLTVTRFDSRLDVRGLSVGQLNDVRLVAGDIRWRTSAFDTATVVLHNVHVRPGAPPQPFPTGARGAPAMSERTRGPPTQTTACGGESSTRRPASDFSLSIS